MTALLLSQRGALCKRGSSANGQGQRSWSGAPACSAGRRRNLCTFTQSVGKGGDPRVSPRVLGKGVPRFRDTYATLLCEYDREVGIEHDTPPTEVNRSRPES